MIFKFCLNLKFMNLLRYNDVMFWIYIQFLSLFSPYLDLVIIVMVKIMYTNFLGNFLRIPKMILKFCPNLIFMDLWRHIDVMIRQYTYLPSLILQYLVLLITVKINITLFIFLEVFPEISENDIEIMPKFDFCWFITS